MSTSELISEPVSTGLATWKSEQAKVLTNFQGEAREAFAFRMKCINATGGGDAALNDLLLMEYWLVHEVDIMSEEIGGLVKALRTVLVTSDGDAIAFVSQGVANGVRQIHSEFGLERLDPPLAVRVEQRSTAKKRRVYVLTVVNQEQEAKAKKK